MILSSYGKRRFVQNVCTVRTDLLHQQRASTTSPRRRGAHAPYQANCERVLRLAHPSLPRSWPDLTGCRSSMDKAAVYEHASHLNAEGAAQTSADTSYNDDDSSIDATVAQLEATRTYDRPSRSGLSQMLSAEAILLVATYETNIRVCTTSRASTVSCGGHSSRSSACRLTTTGSSKPKWPKSPPISVVTEVRNSCRRKTTIRGSHSTDHSFVSTSF